MNDWETGTFDDLECYLFQGLIERDVFEQYSTPEKIEWCIRKDVFVYRETNSLSFYKFNCVDIDRIDFSAFEKEVFNLYEGYKLNEGFITVNPLFEEEVLNIFDTQIAFGGQTDEIDFHLNTHHSKKSKIKYLQKKIDGYSPFDLKNIIVEHHYWEKKLSLSQDSKGYFASNFFEYKLSWLFGEIMAGSSFYTIGNRKKYDDFKDFIKDYQTFYLARYCYNIINLLSFEANEESQDSNKDSNFNCLAVVYFLEKFDIIRKFQNAGYTNTEIHSILGKVTSYHPKTIESKMKELINPSRLAANRQKHLKEIDALLNSVTDL